MLLTSSVTSGNWLSIDHRPGIAFTHFTASPLQCTPEFNATLYAITSWKLLFVPVQLNDKLSLSHKVLAKLMKTLAIPSSLKSLKGNINGGIVHTTELPLPSQMSQKHYRSLLGLFGKFSRTHFHHYCSMVHAIPTFKNESNFPQISQKSVIFRCLSIQALLIGI